MDYDFSYLWLDILGTVAMFMVFPVIYKIKNNNVSKDKIKKITLINSIVVWFLIIFIKVAYEVYDVTSVLPAFTYYYINKWYLNKETSSKTNCIVGLCFLVICAIVGYYMLSIFMYSLAVILAYFCFYYSDKFIKNVSIVLFYIFSFLLLFVINSYFFEIEQNFYISVFEIIILFALNILFAKNKKENLDETLNKVKCSNCGSLINDNITKCPYCETIIEREKIEEVSIIDNKYNDLMKLKKLLDKKIITEEEFEKEKKKILK